MKTEHKNKILVDDYRDFVALWHVRLVGFLVDLIVIWFIGITLSGYSLSPNQNGASYAWINYLLVTFVLYETVFELLFSKTAGKMFMKTRVVDFDGNRPTFKQIIIRNLIRLVPFEGLSFLGGSRNLASDDKYRPVGWHDRLSSTYVVDEMTSKLRSI